MKQGTKKKPAKKLNRQPRCGRRRFALAAVLLVLALVGGLFGWMALQARITHVRSAVVYLQDLPAALDGTTALFISDLNIRSARDARRTQRLMDKLAALEPDLLLLGGDYCAGKLLDGQAEADEQARAAALDFLRGLNRFSAPLGKYAVAGEQDSVLSGLREAMSAGGVMLLDDDCATVLKDGAQLVLAGLSDVSEGRTP